MNCPGDDTIIVITSDLEVEGLKEVQRRRSVAHLLIAAPIRPGAAARALGVEEAAPVAPRPPLRVEVARKVQIRLHVSHTLRN